MNVLNTQMQGFGAPAATVQAPQAPTPVATMGGTAAAMPNAGNLSGIGVQIPGTNGTGVMPQVGGVNTTGAYSGGGFMDQIGGWSGISSGIQTLGNLYMAYQQNKLAKESLKFQKDSYKTNLANQSQTYNTALEDRIRSRYNTEGKSSSEADQYLEKNSL